MKRKKKLIEPQKMSLEELTAYLLKCFEEGEISEEARTAMRVDPYLEELEKRIKGETAGSTK